MVKIKINKISNFNIEMLYYLFYYNITIYYHLFISTYFITVYIKNG